MKKKFNTKLFVIISLGSLALLLLASFTLASLMVDPYSSDGLSSPLECYNDPNYTYDSSDQFITTAEKK